MTLEIELRCILFPLIIFDVSTTWLESTCGKFNWLDMIWKGARLSIKGFCQSKTKPWGRKELSVECRDRIVPRHRFGEGYQKCLQHWRSPRTQWHPSFLYGRSLEPSRLFLELVIWPIWAIGGRRTLVREVTKNPMALISKNLVLPFHYGVLWCHYGVLWCHYGVLCLDWWGKQIIS